MSDECSIISLSRVDLEVQGIAPSSFRTNVPKHATGD